LIAVAAATLVLPDQARAQWRTKYFGVDRPEVVSESGYEIEDEKVTTSFTDREEHTDTISQGFEVKSSGWVYHPALLIFNSSLRPRWKSQTTTTTGTSGREDTLLFLGRTIDATILQFKPYTVNLFTSNTRSQFDSALSPDSITSSSVDRGTLFLKYQPVPTTVILERRATDFSGFNEFRDTTFLGRVESQHEIDRSASRAKLEYATQERASEFTSFSITRMLFNATNNFEVSDNKRLFSSLRGSRSSSEMLTSTILGLSENFAWEHTETLKSDYRLRLESRDDQNFSSKAVYGSTELRHQLYENLTTTVLAQGQEEWLSTGETRTLDGDLDLAYTRRIPWGSISLSNGYRLGYSGTMIDVVVSQVRDESLVLGGTELVFLRNLDVDATSIVVTDATGLILFTENVDYIVTTIGDSVAIARVGVGSTIGDGARVLVDYRFTPVGPFELTSVGLRFGAGVNLWNMLNLSYNYSHTKATLLSGFRPASLADDTIQRARAEFRWRWSTTELEYEDRDTVRTPLTRWAARQALTFRPFRTLSLGVGASYSETSFVNTGNMSTQISGNANIRWRPLRSVEIAANAFTRRLRGDIQRTESTGILSQLRWRYGKWSGFFKFEYLRERDVLNGQSRDRQSALAVLRREF